MKIDCLVLILKKKVNLKKFIFSFFSPIYNMNLAFFLHGLIYKYFYMVQFTKFVFTIYNMNFIFF